MTINRSKLFRDAWNRARSQATRLGGRARSYFADALKAARHAIQSRQIA